MESKSEVFTLEVLHGDDRGARLEVDREVRSIGRALDRDLVLKDAGVSRRHVEVVATDGGVRFTVCEGASAIVIEGRPFRSVETKPGDHVLIGSTLMLVSEVVAAPGSEPRPAREQMDVRTALGGVGADARSMGAIHDLIEAADAATDHASLFAAVALWSSGQTPPSSVRVLSGHEARLEVVEHDEGGATVITVPAPSIEPTSLAFTCAASAGRVSESYRRMLVVAARLFGSSLIRLHRSEIAAAEVAALRSISFGSARGFLGTSPAAEQLARLLPRLATSDSTVLLGGETGSGKTFVARLIHEQGPRAGEPLRVINCAAIPEALIESELFGHERGAFTGAVAKRIGAIESAGRGTLFLDEIGELPLASQSKLLRVLEERRFERIGSNKPLTLEARVICATNRDLDAMVASKQFRSDLFFRISIIRMTVPPLRDRGDDLLLLAEHLLHDAAQNAGRRIVGFSKEALDVIRSYSWPGNVRELRNAIEHAIAIGDGGQVLPSDLPAGLVAAPVQPEDANMVRLPLSMPEIERLAIAAAMRHTNGNRTRAAALLDISRGTLIRHLAEGPASESKE